MFTLSTHQNAAITPKEFKNSWFTGALVSRLIFLPAHWNRPWITFSLTSVTVWEAPASMSSDFKRGLTAALRFLENVIAASDDRSGMLLRNTDEPRHSHKPLYEESRHCAKRTDYESYSKDISLKFSQSTHYYRWLHYLSK